LEHGVALCVSHDSLVFAAVTGEPHDLTRQHPDDPIRATLQALTGGRCSFGPPLDNHAVSPIVSDNCPRLFRARSKGAV
jgi:hypothetical protein